MLDSRTHVLYNSSVEPWQIPLSITRSELEAFNQYWQSLSPPDRQLLAELLAAASQRQASVDSSGRPLPYQTYLLSLLIEERKELLRLRRLLDDQRR